MCEVGLCDLGVSAEDVNEAQWVVRGEREVRDVELPEARWVGELSDGKWVSGRR